MRSFSIATSLVTAAALLVAAPAGALQYEAPPVPDRGRVEMVVDRDVVKLNYILVLNRANVVGLDLTKAVRQVDSARRDLVQMMRDHGLHSMQRELADAHRVGTVYYAKRNLFVLPDEGDIGRSHASIVNGDLSYLPSRMMTNFRLDRRPSEAELHEYGIVGEAWQNGSRLILVVNRVVSAPML